MSLILTLHAPDGRLAGALQGARDALAQLGARIGPEDRLGPHALDIPVDGVEAAAARAALKDLDADWCAGPVSGRRKRLLVCDMDSTIIGCECVDELARFSGVGEEVAAVTEAAMRGDLDFEGSLRKRVALLKGLPQKALARVYAERVRLNPGARALTATMAAHGARTLLVSGGFTFFAEKVARDAGFDSSRANVLEFEGDALTGRVVEPILGRAAKREALDALAAETGLAPGDAVAIGDGANDLGMMSVAGLSVAYRAKPVVAAQAHARINSGDLRAALHFQGYRAEEIVEPA